MIIAVDTSIVLYALKCAILSENDDEVNYICNRIKEAIPQMQRTLCIWILQDIDKYLKDNDPDYCKLQPLKRLREAVDYQRKEFKHEK